MFLPQRAWFLCQNSALEEFTSKTSGQRAAQNSAGTAPSAAPTKPRDSQRASRPTLRVMAASELPQPPTLSAAAFLAARQRDQHPARDQWRIEFVQSFCASVLGAQLELQTEPTSSACRCRAAVFGIVLSDVMSSDAERALASAADEVALRLCPLLYADELARSEKRAAAAIPEDLVPGAGEGFFVDWMRQKDVEVARRAVLAQGAEIADDTLFAIEFERKREEMDGGATLAAVRKAVGELESIEVTDEMRFREPICLGSKSTHAELESEMEAQRWSQWRPSSRAHAALLDLAHGAASNLALVTRESEEGSSVAAAANQATSPRSGVSCNHGTVVVSGTADGALPRPQS